MRRMALCAVAAIAPVTGFFACSSGDSPLAVPPRQDLPVPPDADEANDGAGDDARSDASLDARDDAHALPSGVLALATGAGPHPDPTIGWGDHSCAIAGPERRVFCWGANEHGQTGTGGALDGGLVDGGLVDGGVADDVRSALELATDEQGLPFAGADAIALAAWHSCARRGNDLYCWGQRFSGAQAEPPFAANPDRRRPRLVGAFPIAGVVAGGPHTCVVRATGKLACFGHATFGELGRPNAESAPCAAPILYDYPGLDGGAHLCDGEIVDMAQPTSGVQGLAAGELHACALVGGRVRCWGTNAGGELGAPPLTGAAQPTPQEVLSDPDAGKALDTVAQIAAGGGKHTCALTSLTVQCWGSNAHGELGFDPLTVPQRASAAPVPGLDLAVSIGVGDGVSCAIKSDSSLWCWGADDVGQLGDGVPKPFSATPVQVKGPANVGVLAGVKEVAPGRRHVCARLNDATAWCWGKNDRGQLGDGTGVDSLYPVKVKGLP